MSYNTIKLSLTDIDKRPVLYNKFVHGNIKPEELRELKRILENERYFAIKLGNVQTIFYTTRMLENIDNYMKEKGISTISDMKLSGLD